MPGAGSNWSPQKISAILCSVQRGPHTAYTANDSAERCWSGRTGLTANQFHPKRVTGVRIPPSPPEFSHHIVNRAVPWVIDCPVTEAVTTESLFLERCRSAAAQAFIIPEDQAPEEPSSSHIIFAEEHARDAPSLGFFRLLTG